MKNPISLDKLPDYLKNINGNTDDSLVVDMGRIVNNKTNWYKRVGYSALSACLVLTIGFFINNITSSRNVTISMDSNYNLQTVSKIISDNGGKIVSIKQNEDDTYQIEFTTRKNSKLFIEWLRKEIKKTELKK
jgi:hypothetical protein